MLISGTDGNEPFFPSHKQEVTSSILLHGSILVDENKSTALAEFTKKYIQNAVCKQDANQVGSNKTEFLLD